MALTDEERFGFQLTVTVQQWAKITIAELRKQIVAKKAYKTGDLYKSFRYEIYKDSNGVPTRVTIGFDMHGRFIDMGVGGGIRIENQKVNREKWNSMTYAAKEGKKRRKPIKWYSPEMYHQYQRMAEILTGKYGIEIPARFESMFNKDLETLEVKI